MNQGKEGIAAQPRRGRFIAPIADLSALADYRSILFISIIASTPQHRFYPKVWRRNTP